MRKFRVAAFNRTTTISFWINTINYASPGRQNPFDQAYGGWGTMTLETSGAINWYFGNNGGNGSSYIGAGSGSGLINNGAWIYITAVRSPDGHTYKWYKNGTYVSGSTYSSSYPVINTRTFTMGDGYVNHINGKMDEFRVSNSVRSVAWISAEYENQNSPTTFYSLDSEETQGTVATFTVNEDIAITGLTKSTIKRLRVEISNKGGQVASNVQYRLEVSGPNPAKCAVGSYERVSTDADWEMVNSTYITDGEASNNIDPGLTDANSSFIAGQLKDNSDQTDTIVIAGTTGFTEIEYSIQATANSTDGATYCFRLTNAGSTDNFTYTKYGQATVGAVISIIISDGAVDFGHVSLNGTVDNDPDDIQIITVNAGPADLDIKSSGFSDGVHNWTLGPTNGLNQVKWEFASTTPKWTIFTVADTLYTLDKNVAQGQTKNVYLKITMPTVTDSYDEYGSTVTIVASDP